MDEKEARIAFNLVEGMGWAHVKEMAERAGGIAAAYEALPPEQRIDWRGREPDWQGEIARAERLGVKIVVPGEDDWPSQLDDLSSPPLALYVFGDPKALSVPAVAIIGTRRATRYGLAAAERIAAGIARSGRSVVSGLAEGIDGAAHRGALEAGGVSVGILGGALDEFFPESNRSLARRMASAGGAVASEFPFGRHPDRSTFPRRNRIVAALGRGVVAIECPERSGTLITAGLAADLGRVVMAVPGPIDSPASAGTNNLIREGARLVTSADDIIEEISPLAAKKADLGPRGRFAPPPREKRRSEPASRAAVSPEEAPVLAAIGEEPTSLDKVTAACNLPAPKVNSIVMGLRLKRLIKLLPGNRVARMS